MTMTDDEATIASDGCRLLTIDAAADFLAISRGAVYHLLDRGEMSSIHIGRSRRIALAELRRFVANCGHATPTVAT
jgi:excisionase family DNA binding protein